MTVSKLPPLEELRAEAERLGIRWQPFGVCRRKLSDKIEAELKRRNDQDDRESAWHRRQDELRKTSAGRQQIAEELEREEAIEEWIRIVHGVEPLERKARDVADKIARMGEEIENLREKLGKSKKKIEALKESEAAKDRQVERSLHRVREGDRQIAELKARIATQEQQLKEIAADMFNLEHARDVARKHAQERGRSMYSGPRARLDRLQDIERRLCEIEDKADEYQGSGIGRVLTRMIEE